MQNITQQLQNDLLTALKQKQGEKATTIRGLISALKNKQIELNKDLLDQQEVLAVIEKQAKQRKDSIEAYKAGNRDDLVKKEEQELQIIEEYLPKKLSEQETKELITSLISKHNLSGKENMGKLMGLVKASEKPVDMSLVSKIAQNLL